MPIPITCGGCGVVLQAPDNLAGRKVKCSKCGTGIMVPGGSASPSPVAAAPRPARPAPRPAPPAEQEEDLDFQETKRGRRGVASSPSSPDKWTFDGTVGGFLGTAILAALLCVFTLYIGTPWAICMFQRWQKHHTLVGGRRLRFVGTGGALFVKLLVWYLLTIVTCYVYSLWAYVNFTRWITENTEFDD